MCEFFFADPVDEIEIECPCCDGGTVETGPYRYDHRTGEPILWSHTCMHCGGRGSVFVACEPVYLQDLLDIDAEMAAAGGE